MTVHKAGRRQVFDRIGVTLVGAGMVVAFFLIAFKLVGYLVDPSAPDNPIQMMLGYLQYVCSSIPLDIPCR